LSDIYLQLEVVEREYIKEKKATAKDFEVFHEMCLSTLVLSRIL